MQSSDVALHTSFTLAWKPCRFITALALWNSSSLRRVSPKTIIISGVSKRLLARAAYGRSSDDSVYSNSSRSGSAEKISSKVMRRGRCRWLGSVSPNQNSVKHSVQVAASKVDNAKPVGTNSPFSCLSRLATSSWKSYFKSFFPAACKSYTMRVQSACLAA